MYKLKLWVYQEDNTQNEGFLKGEFTETRITCIYFPSLNFSHYIFFISGIKDESVIIEKDNIESTFETRSVNLFLRDVKGKNYSLQVLNLNNDIIPDSSSVKITKTGATISMKKAASGKWNDLKVSHEKKEDMPKPDKSADPQAGMMDMMKKMYDEGDDDMKRQIGKSMYESQQKQRGGDAGAMPDMSGMEGMGGRECTTGREWQGWTD